MSKKILYSTLVLCLVLVFYCQTTSPNTLVSSSVVIEFPQKDSLESFKDLDFTGNNQYQNSIVKVIVPMGNDLLCETGFFISNYNIITTAHGLQIKDGTYDCNPMIQFYYQETDGTTIPSKMYKCQIHTINLEKDIAIGTVNDNWVLSVAKPLVLSEKTPTRNDCIDCYGYPNNNIDLIKISGNLINHDNISVRDNFNNNLFVTDSLKCNLPIDHGNSGSPLINNEGSVVGIVFAGNLKNHTAYAIKTSDILFVLKR